MSLFSHHRSNNNEPARSVPLVQDAAATPAVSLDKVEQQGGVSLRKKSEASHVSLRRKISLASGRRSWLSSITHTACHPTTRATKCRISLSAS